MSSYIYPTALGSLSPREAITDAVQRILIAMDENSSALFESGWAGEDVTFDFDGAVTQGLTDIRSFVLGRIGPLDTQHCLSNVRIDVKDGADAAVLTANCVAQHCPPGRGMEPNGPKLLGGSRMWIDVVKADGDGLWKVKKWAMKVVWRDGDPSVLGH